MKDYNRQITCNSLNNFVDYTNDKGYDLEVIEGVLNDTYIINNYDKELSIKGVKVQSSLDTIDDIKITGACKREEILPILENYTFIIFYDKFGNGYSRIIY